MTLTSGAAPLVPRRIRRSATALAVACALVLVALAARYRDTDAAGQLDIAAMSRIQDLLANHSQELWLIVRLGGPVPIFAMAVLLASVSLATRRPRLAVLAFAGPGATGVVTTVLQPLVGRTLEGDFSLPSGHTGVATAISAVAALVVIGLVRTRLVTVAAVAAAVVFAVGTVMGIALIANGLHYPTDVVAGFCAALAIVLVLGLVLDSIKPRARRRSAPGIP
ncbi:MAG: phosphatase PAP2 family protein [Pseudonocardiales bacterium]